MADIGCTSWVPSLPPPCPKSPPEYPDLYGKRRGLAKVQMLEREIGFLEEELKSVEGLQPASRYCKEVSDFVVANSDPLIPTNRKIRRPCRFWKWLCGASCFNFSWICCYGCSFHLKMPRCCDCNSCNCCSWPSCTLPKWRCCSWPHCRCLNRISCSSSCCILQCPSCPDCCCCRWTCSCPKCPRARLCSSCTKSCCDPCYLCY